MPQTDSPLVYPLPEDPHEHKRALYEQVARVGKACSQPVRLEILEFLAQCPRTVETLTDLLQIDYKNVSAHLKVLLQAGLVSVRRFGRFRQYAISSTEVLHLVVVLQQTARVTEVAAASNAQGGEHEESQAREDGGVDLESALKLADAGDLVLIDVRPREEFDAGHLPNAKSMPLECIERMLPDLPADKLCAAYCRGSYCFLAQRAARVFAEHGRELLVIREGVMDWRGDGRDELLEKEEQPA